MLPNIFYAIPRDASTVMTTKDLKNTLLATNGTIFAHGVQWEINSKKIGPGIYKVTLTED
jgi:hypothetical protein